MLDMCEWTLGKRIKRDKAMRIDCVYHSTRRCRCASKHWSRTSGGDNYTWNNGKLSSQMYPMEKRTAPQEEWQRSDSQARLLPVERNLPRMDSWNETIRLRDITQWKRLTFPNCIFFQHLKKKKKKNLEVSSQAWNGNCHRVNRRTAPPLGPIPALNSPSIPLAFGSETGGRKGWDWINQGTHSSFIN